MYNLLNEEDKRKFLLDVFFEKKHEYLELLKNIAIEEKDQNLAILATQIYLYLSHHPRNYILENQIRNLLKPPANVALLSDEMLNYLSHSAPSSLTIITLESVTYKSFLTSKSNLRSFIIKTCVHPSSAIRIASCKAAVATKDPELFIHLLLRITDIDINVAKYVFKLLNEIPRKELNSILLKALEIKNETYQNALAKFIPFIANKDLEPFLSKALNHTNSEISKSANYAFEKINSLNKILPTIKDKLKQLPLTTPDRSSEKPVNQQKLSTLNKNLILEPDLSNLTFSSSNSNIESKDKNIQFEHEIQPHLQNHIKNETKPKTERIISVRDKLAKKYQNHSDMQADTTKSSSTQNNASLSPINQTSQAKSSVITTYSASNLPTQSLLNNTTKIDNIKHTYSKETTQEVKSLDLTSVQIKYNENKNSTLQPNTKAEAIILKFPSFISKPLENIYETYPKSAFLAYYSDLINGFIAYLLFTFLQTYLFYSKRNQKFDDLVKVCIKENLIFIDSIRAINQFAIIISEQSGNDNFFTFALARQILESENVKFLHTMQNLWTTAINLKSNLEENNLIRDNFSNTLETLVEMLAFCKLIISNKLVYKTPPGAREPYFDLTGPTLVALKPSERPTFDAPSGEIIILSKDKSEALGLFPFFNFDGEKIVYKKPTEQSLKLLFERLEIL